MSNIASISTSTSTFTTVMTSKELDDSWVIVEESQDLLDSSEVVLVTSNESDDSWVIVEESQDLLDCNEVVLVRSKESSDSMVIVEESQDLLDSSEVVLVTSNESNDSMVEKVTEVNKSKKETSLAKRLAKKESFYAGKMSKKKIAWELSNESSCCEKFLAEIITEKAYDLTSGYQKALNIHTALLAKDLEGDLFLLPKLLYNEEGQEFRKKVDSMFCIKGLVITLKDKKLLAHSSKVKLT